MTVWRALILEPGAQGMVILVSLVKERPVQRKSSATVWPVSPKGGRKFIVVQYCNYPFLSRKYFWMALVWKIVTQILFRDEDFCPFLMIMLSTHMHIHVLCILVQQWFHSGSLLLIKFMTFILSPSAPNNTNIHTALPTPFYLVYLGYWR